MTEERSGLTAEEERLYALARYERPIVFPDDVKTTSAKFKEIWDKTQGDYDQRNPKYGPEHRFRPEDYEEIKSRREQALKEKSQRLNQAMVPVRLLGCRRCGYAEWRVKKPDHEN